MEPGSVGSIGKRAAPALWLVRGGGLVNNLVRLVTI